MTPNLPPAEENRQVLEEASTWFVEFRVGAADLTTRRKFARWLRCSPEHIRAYMEISGTYARLPSREFLETADVDRLIAQTRSRNTVVSLESGLGKVEPRREPARRFSAPRSVWLLAGAAATLAVLVLGSILFLHPAPLYETQTGEQRILTLEDGSRIELNARSRVRVAFTTRSRTVELLDGQTFFHIAKDAHRPFVVNAGGVRVEALGTEFDVYRKESGTTVTVVEGRVSVQSPGPGETTRESARVETRPESAPTRRSLELSAGEQAVVSASRLAKSERANVAAATAWMQSQLEFDETPLQEAAAEFNRYSPKPLVIDPAVSDDLRISGVYSVTDTASLLLFLRNQPDLSVTETDTDIRIGKK